MHWTRRVGLVCLVAIGCVNVCSAQSIIDSGSDVVYLDDFSGSMSLANDGGTYILFSKVVGKGVGHSEGFSRIGIRAKLMDNIDSHLFGEFHGLITDEARLGLNIGGGYRWMYRDGLLGVNSWYDSQESQSGNNYQQITGGLEYLSPGFDLRTNAYVPISDRESFLGIVDSGDLSSRAFFQNFLATDGTALYERANYGWDAEAGTQVPVIEWLRAYAGAYFLNHSDNATWGARARLEASLFQGGNVNLSVSNDDKFGTNVNLEAEVRFSGAMPTRFNTDYGSNSRKYAQVRRQWNIQISQDVDNYKVPTIAPDGSIIRVTHVDGSAAAGGDGTFENPFQRLPNAARESDLVLVRSGADVAGNIQLVDMQQMLGEGKAHFINVRTRETGAINNVQLPSSFASTGPFPNLIGGSNPTTPVITLADSNIVSGFNFTAPNAIAGGDINNFFLECLTGNVTNGINIANGHGVGVIRDVNFAVNPSGTGASITNLMGGLTLDVDNVTTSGGANGLVLNANGGNILYDINTFNGTAHSDAALKLRAENAYISGNATAITTSNNTGHGVQIETVNGTGKTTLSNIQSNSNGKDGVNAVADGSSNYSLDVIGTALLPSSISMNADDNIQTDAINTSTMNVFIDPITLASAGDNAYEFLADNSSLINTRLDDVTMMLSTNDAVHGVVSRNSIGNLIINRSNGSSSGDDGVDLVVSGTSTFNGTINDSIFSGNGLTSGTGNGIDATVTQGSVATLNLNNVLSNANANAGLQANTSGGGMGPATLTVNSGGGTNFSNNVRSNVVGTASDNSRTNLNMTNVIANGGANNGGVVLDARTGGRVNNVWNGGSVSNTDGDGFRAIGVNANSRVDLALTGVTVNNNAGDGIDATLNGAPNGQMNIALTDSSLTNNMVNGLDIQIDGNNALGSVAFNNTAAAGNRGDGFQFDVTGGADLIGTATGPGNNFSANLNNGIDGTVDGIGSTAVINIDTALADNNGHAGILLDTNNNGVLTFNYSNGSASGNQRDGIFVSTQNNSIANINLNTVSLNGNGLGLVSSGDGFTGIADTSSTLNANLNFVQASGNREKGFNFRANNGGGIAINPTGGAMAAINNGEEGLFFDARNGGMFSLNALDGFYNDNGTTGVFSGIRGNVDGAGSAASVSFDGSQVTGNTNDGFEFTVTNDAMFIGELISATQPQAMLVDQNAGEGISLIATGAGTTAVLVMEGQNVITNNGGAGLLADANGINQFAVQASGRFESNGSNGINIASNNVGTTAIEVTGTNTTVSDNVGDGIRIDVSNTTLANIDVTTLTQTETVEAFSLSGVNVNRATGHGINVTMDNVTSPLLNFNDLAIEESMLDGLHVEITNSAIDEIMVNRNNITVAGNNGINFNVTNSAVNTLTMTENTVGGNGDNGILLNLDGTPVTELNVSNNNTGAVGGVTVTPIDDSLPIIRPGFDINTLPSNDDGSTGLVDLGFNLNFFGQFFSQGYVNNNGNITFNAPLATFTPFGLLNTSTPIIAPFFADVDTNDIGGIMTNDVTYGQGFINGQAAFAANYIDVRHFSVTGSNQGLPTNTFQVVLVDRSDIRPGDFDLEFNYSQVLWEAGTASGSDPFGLGGSAATIGFSNGVDTAFELAGSGVNGAFLDGGPAATSLIQNNLNSLNNGRYLFFARDGEISTTDIGVVGNGTNGAGDGIQINMINGSNVGTLTANGNISGDNTSRGIAINSNNSDVNGGTISNNIVTNNASHGIEINFTDAAFTDVNVNTNQVNGNGGDGIRFDFNNAPITNLTVSDNPDIIGNGANGVNFLMVDSNITGLTIDNNGMGVIAPPPPPPSTTYDINVAFGGGLTPSQQAIFQQAEMRWEQIITSDLIDMGSIDDLIISASGVNIDGAGGILGQAGPTGLRTGSFLPFQGIMQFDIADLAALEASGQLEDVILHEMAHVMGFGTIWDDLGLLAGAGTADPRFTGLSATTQHNTIFGTSDAGVPVENTGGPGTRDGHWRDSIYNNELMTGFLNAGIVNPISATTIGQWEDLGYTVDFSQADTFPLVSPLIGPPTTTGPALVGDTVLRPYEHVADMSNMSNLSSMFPAINGLPSFTQNGMNGINISLTNSNLTGGTISRNIIADHAGGDGVRLITPTTQGAAIELDFTGNMITGNTGGAGINVSLNGTEQLNSAMVDNTISGSGQQGLNVVLADTAGVNISDFTRNTVDANGAHGVRIAANGTNTVNFAAGVTSAATDLNVISNNVDAGIGISMAGASTGTISITNTNVSGTTDGTDATFNGDGLALLLTDTASVTNLQVGHVTEQNTSFSGNEGDGIRIRSLLNSTLNNPVIQNSAVTLNGADGLNFLRQGSGVIDNVVIRASNFENNTGDGIDITSSVGNLTDEFTIMNNVIGTNGGRGLSLRAEFDADITATISGNTIGNNGDDGVELSEMTVVPALDSRSITASFNDNSITGNQGWGVDVLALHELSFDGNTIDNNTLGGINLTADPLTPFRVIDITNGSLSNNGGPGLLINNDMVAVNVTGNQINGNTGDGISNLLGVDSTINNNSISNNIGNGIAITGGTHTINNNMIEGNTDDGIQLISNATNNLTVTADMNTVRSNQGRGLNMLVQGSTRADVTFNNSLFEGNTLEGVYIVNTASTTQNVDAAATDALAADGDIFATPELVFNFDNNMVMNNGLGSGFGGSGLVIRVGTSGASNAANAYEDNGGLVSDGLGFTAANLTGRGGVLANVTNNTIASNPSADVLFESFVSTRAPIATAGTWDAATYTITAFEQDPLARFDLNFVGNNGDDLNVTRPGASFNNVEDVFKSRTTAQLPAGPFTAGNRARNATRLAARGGAFGDPALPTIGAAGNSSNFLYSGVGGSTFRVTNASATAGFTGGDNFGTTDPLGLGIGELPFGWDTY